MKHIVSTLSVALLALNVSAQDVQPEQQKKREKVRLDRGPAMYITTSTGINNNTGVVGFNFELPVSPHVTIDGGPGTGTWNHKLYIGAKYYLRPAQRGFAFGTGITHATGTRGNSYWATTVYGDRRLIRFNKNPQTNAFFAAYKYWSLGKQYNRFYAQLGWSLPLSAGDKITQLSGPATTQDSKNSIASAAPGGPILAVGVSFGVH
ncbi:MAG: hypothetical protein V4649_04950 [Bacteroidota bacterium]